MMRGLLAKTLRECWLTTLLFGVPLLAVNALLTYVLPQNVSSTAASNIPKFSVGRLL